MSSSKKTYISVSLVDDAEMTSLNNDFKGKNVPTDVLSFEIKKELEDGTFYLGDIVVNSQQAERQAKEYGNGVEREIAELVEHGVLHLLGIHHEEDY